MTEPLDEVSAQHLKYYEGKKFVDVSKETFDLGMPLNAMRLFLVASECVKPHNTCGGPKFKVYYALF